MSNIYKQHERYEVLFWRYTDVNNDDAFVMFPVLKLVGRISRDNHHCCIIMLEHEMEKENRLFDGMAVYDCGELITSAGTCGNYAYGPPFSPKG